MKVRERRAAIARLLLAEKKAITGGALSEKFGVSRQIIVQDIAALNNSGYEVMATHTGYVIKTSPLKERVFKVKHTTDETEDELNTIVDAGGTVADVFVCHRVYGRISAALNIHSRADVASFIEGVRSGKSTELMNITGGYHYHTVRADSESILDKISKQLSARGYAVPEEV